MNDNNVIPLQPKGPFSREAKARWDKIPRYAQMKLLENVWCTECSDITSILLDSAEMEQRNLILRGTCNKCGGEVCRLIEPEDR
ncbi:MAG TPA: hypothetical protein ENH23_07580 [candidate division Zixibacteria bacterium]|nr:hypothetical protein [candidate division Zixibacteria bacterium]